MSMTIVITRNAPDRYRGFLSSCMVELAPGIYTNPNMTRAVRDRVWGVCCDWAEILPDDGGIIMTWREKQSPSGQAFMALGWPKKELVELDGIWIDRLPNGSLKTE